MENGKKQVKLADPGENSQEYGRQIAELYTLCNQVAAGPESSSAALAKAFASSPILRTIVRVNVPRESTPEQEREAIADATGKLTSRLRGIIRDHNARIDAGEKGTKITPLSPLTNRQKGSGKGKGGRGALSPGFLLAKALGLEKTANE